MHPVVSAKLRDMDEAELRTAKKEDIVGLIQVGFWPVLSGCRMFLVLGFFFFLVFFFVYCAGNWWAAKREPTTLSCALIEGEGDGRENGRGVQPKDRILKGAHLA